MGRMFYLCRLNAWFYVFLFNGNKGRALKVIFQICLSIKIFYEFISQMQIRWQACAANTILSYDFSATQESTMKCL